MKTFVGYVHITKHARDRFVQRRINLSSNEKKYCNVYKKMLNMIFRSRLLKYKKGSDGEIYELRVFQGCVFFCKREYGKSFMDKDVVTVITVELTETFMRERSLMGYNIEDVELTEFMINKMKRILA